MARIGLTQLPRKVQAHVLDQHGVTIDAPSYRRAFDAAVQNRFPAEFSNGRWSVDEADLSKVAAAMGMVPARPVPVAA